MSEPTIARFPHSPLGRHEHDAHGAHKARQRIAELPDPYLAHATPAKEHLIGAVKPVSPAAETEGGRKHARHPHLEVPKEFNPAPVQDEVVAKAAPVAANPLATPEANVANEFQTVVAPRPKRSLPSRLQPLLIGLGTFVVLYFVFKPELLLSQINYLLHPQAQSTPALQAQAQIPPDPTISIPKINVNAPVVYATSNDENAILTDLQSGVVHYANTALPGQPGNSVIFGHSSNDWWEPGNYKFVFVLLDKLVPGDTFTVNYQSHQYLYKVVSSTVVDPTDVAVLNQTPDPEMTLITCSPPGTSWKRLVVVAKQVSPAPGAAATTPKGPSASGTTLPSNSPSITDDIATWLQSAKNFVTGKKSSSQKPNTAPANAPSTLPAVQ